MSMGLPRKAEKLDLLKDYSQYYRQLACNRRDRPESEDSSRSVWRSFGSAGRNALERIG